MPLQRISLTEFNVLRKFKSDGHVVFIFCIFLTRTDICSCVEAGVRNADTVRGKLKFVQFKIRAQSPAWFCDINQGIKVLPTACSIVPMSEETGG